MLAAIKQILQETAHEIGRDYKNKLSERKPHNPAVKSKLTYSFPTWLLRQ